MPNRRQPPLGMPFGPNDADVEGRYLSDRYLADLAFVNQAFDSSVSVILGRRGSGKTALAHYLEHPIPAERFAIIAKLDQVATFRDLIAELAISPAKDALSVNALTLLWERAFWLSLMERLYDLKHLPANEQRTLKLFLESEGIEHPSTLAQIAKRLFEHFIQELPTGERLLGLAVDIGEILTSRTFIQARQIVLSYLNQSRRAAIIIDSLDSYEISERGHQIALAALLGAVHRFSHGNIHHNLHVKCFLPSELSPIMRTSGLIDAAKVIENPLFLQWSAHDLLRMAAKRLYAGEQWRTFSDGHSGTQIEWDHYTNVKRNIWDRYFNITWTDTSGYTQSLFTYVARHTQLQPRHVITLLNTVALVSYQRGHWPSSITSLDVIDGVRRALSETISDDVISVYSEVYPGIVKVMYEAFTKEKHIMPASDLNKLFNKTKKVWPVGSPWDSELFKRMVIETGIVGIVDDDAAEDTKVLSCTFQYNHFGFLSVGKHDRVAIHPMFYGRFGTVKADMQTVVPHGASVEEAEPYS